jgi:hypothetical protein
MPVVGAAGAYLGGKQVRVDLGVVPSVLAESLIGGLKRWFGDVFGASPSVVAAMLAAFGGTFLIGALGYLVSLRNRQWRRRAALTLAAVLAVVISAVLMRAIVPYDMTTVTRVCALGVIAIGLARLLGPRPLAAVAASAVLAHLALVAGVAFFQSRGGWPLAHFPLFNVIGERHDQPRPVLMLPAYAMSRSAVLLCRGPLGRHGPYAWHVLHGHALEGRLACGKVDIREGGPKERGRDEWIGLPRGLLRTAGISDEKSMGPFGLLPVRRVLGDPVAMISPGEPRYPPVTIATTAPERRVFELQLTEGERLAVSNLAFPFTYAAEPQVSVYAEGKPLEPTAGDGMGQIWNCERCTVGLRIEVRAADFRYLDIATF